MAPAFTPVFTPAFVPWSFGYSPGPAPRLRGCDAWLRSCGTDVTPCPLMIDLRGLVPGRERLVVAWVCACSGVRAVTGACSVVPPPPELQPGAHTAPIAR